MSAHQHHWHAASPGLDDDAEGFRGQVCAWLTEAMAHAPADPRDRTGVRETFERELLRRAGDRGWLALDLSPGRAAAFAYEAAYHDAPLIDTGVVLASAPILMFGTDEQRAELLPGMTGGTATWCVAYSEPGAGNDLLSRVATVAEPDGDGWRIDGVKSLVTGAAKADHCLTVARTGTDSLGRPELTMFTLPMTTAGVGVRRRPTIAGYTLDEIRFENVRVGPGAVLGAVGAGRRQLAAAVRAEHGAVFHAGWADRMLHELAAWCRRTGADPVVRDLLGDLWARGAAARELAFAPVRDPEGDPVAASVAKVFLTEFLQDVADAATGIAGPDGDRLGSIAGPQVPGAPWGGRFAFEYLFRVDGPISVGANELHRDTITRWALAEPDAAVAPPGRLSEDASGPAEGADPGRSEALAELGLPRLVAAAEERAALAMPGAAPLVQARTLREPGTRADARVYVACDAGPEAGARPVLRGGRLRGAVPGVPDPALHGDPSAVRFVVVADGPSGPELAVVGAEAEGVRHETVPSLGPHPSGVLHLDTSADGAPVDERALARARDVAALVTAAEAVGAARDALRVALAEVRRREAYGGTVADLQAVRQRLADMQIDLRAARAVVAAAARDPRRAAVHVAKAYVNEAACRVTASAHRLCGGRGYLEGAGPGRAYRAAKAAALVLGGTRWHRARVADELLGAPRAFGPSADPG